MGKAKRFNSYDNEIQNARRQAELYGQARQNLSIGSSFRNSPLSPVTTSTNPATDSGDNLGNHIATQALDMSNNQINDVSAIFLNTVNENDNDLLIDGTTAGLLYKVTSATDYHLFRVGGTGSSFDILKIEDDQISVLKKIIPSNLQDLGSSSFPFGSVFANTDINSLGTLTIAGNASFGNIGSDLTPDSTGANRNLGESGKLWNHIFMDNTIDIADSTYGNNQAPSISSGRAKIFVRKQTTGKQQLRVRFESGISVLLAEEP